MPAAPVPAAAEPAPKLESPALGDDRPAPAAQEPPQVPPEGQESSGRNGFALGAAAYSESREPEIEAPPQQAGRPGRMRRAGLAFLAAVVGIVAIASALHYRHDGGVSGAQGSAVGATSVVGVGVVAARTAFRNPRTYAAAMSRLSLTGSTKVIGKPTCVRNSTWERWTCQVRGKPMLGEYAGHWLTYRCAPRSEPKRPIVLTINCKPEKLPRLTA